MAVEFGVGAAVGFGVGGTTRTTVGDAVGGAVSSVCCAFGALGFSAFGALGAFPLVFGAFGAFGALFFLLMLESVLMSESGKDAVSCRNRVQKAESSSLLSFLKSSITFRFLSSFPFTVSLMLFLGVAAAVDPRTAARKSVVSPENFIVRAVFFLEPIRRETYLCGLFLIVALEIIPVTGLRLCHSRPPVRVGESGRNWLYPSFNLLWDHVPVAIAHTSTKAMTFNIYITLLYTL